MFKIKKINNTIGIIEKSSLYSSPHGVSITFNKSQLVSLELVTHSLHYEDGYRQPVEALLLEIRLKQLWNDRPSNKYSLPAYLFGHLSDDAGIEDAYKKLHGFFYPVEAIKGVISNITSTMDDTISNIYVCDDNRDLTNTLKNTCADLKNCLKEANQ
jgi:hypothetical protein